MKHFVLFCLLISFVGCSGNSGQTIEGKVSFSDGGPLGMGAVVLSNGINSYMGGLSSDGSYKIDNVVSGEYNVGISGAQVGGTKSTEFQMDYDAEGNYIEPPESDQPPVLMVKETMTNPETSGLTVKVPGTYDIKVERP